MRVLTLGSLLLCGCGALSPVKYDAGALGGGLETGGGTATGGGGAATGGGSASGGGTAATGGGSATGGGTATGGGEATGGGAGTVLVDVLVENRERLGARSTAAFRPWRSGIAVVDEQLYWVESGSDAGLYRAPLEGCDAGACIERLTGFSRPSVFAATPDSVLVADVSVLRRYLADGGVQPIASGSSELVTLGTDGMVAFWCTGSSPVNRTPFGGVTSVPINSNGTPYAMTVAGDSVYWVGVDISGLTAAIQAMKLDGTHPHEVSRSGNGFQTMGGNGAYLYYALDNPARVLRLTLSTETLEEVATNAQGVKDFALDGQWAYWVEPGSTTLGNGRVRRVSHESTTPETVIDSIPYPVGIAVHGGVLYVLSAGTQSSNWTDGRVLRITLP